jgi:hypothetical protein
MGCHYSFLSELSGRIRLSDLIGRRVRLVRRGREYVGLCPFHSEKTPSFYVVEDKGFFYCFGCGAQGDAIGFIARADNISYAKAVEKLASQAGPSRAKVEAGFRACRDSWPAEAVERAAPIWVPILPVPDDAPALLRPDGRTVELINPKRARERKERTIFRPAAWWPYHDAEGSVAWLRVAHGISQAGRNARQVEAADHVLRRPWPRAPVVRCRISRAAAAEPIGEPAPSSPMHTGSSPALNCRPLEGLVRKIIGASEAQLDGTLRWAARLVGNAARKGEIAPEVAEAVLVRAAVRARLAEIAARRTVASSFLAVIMGDPNEAERFRIEASHS